MSIYQPYFYIIQDVRNGMYYAGAKWGKDADPRNFMKPFGYTTSSDIVNYIIETSGFGTFITKRLKLFQTASEVKNYETKFLKKVNARKNPSFYNARNNDGAMDAHKMEILMLQKYGVSIPLQNYEIKKRYNDTCMEKYGVNWILESQDIKVHGMIAKYGVDNYAKTDEWKEKTKSTCQNKYGKDYYIYTDEFKEKSKTTSVEKYGVSHHTKTLQYKENVINGKKLKSQRPIVLEIRKICKEKHLKLGKGWYQKSEEELVNILSKLKDQREQ